MYYTFRIGYDGEVFGCGWATNDRRKRLEGNPFMLGRTARLEEWYDPFGEAIDISNLKAGEMYTDIYNEVKSRPRAELVDVISAAISAS